MTLSIVTVCMNRREHLLVTAPRVAAWPHHEEHLIVDWSSAVPLRREELPEDPRLRLVRVEGELRWNLCRAYNFAVARAGGTQILKLDADAWPQQGFDPEDPRLGLKTSGLLCAFGSGPEGRKGQLLIERELFVAVGGFHELLMGYGFDDKDLQGRLQVQTGEEPASIPSDWLGVIAHTDEERAEQDRAAAHQALRRSLGLAAMRSSRLGNRLLVAHHPWGARRSASRYEEPAPGVWRVIDASVPRPTAETADEVDHARRMVFWSCFLAIPEIFLAELPPKLVPPSRQGRWPVRWWHRLYWHTGRRLLQAPVMLLALGRGRLEAMRSLGGRGRA
jgi:hypothetical protein